MNNILKSKKILIICNSTFAYNNFLTSLFDELNNCGSQVYLIVGKDNYNEKVQFKNKNLFIIDMPERKLFNFISIFNTINNIRKIIKKNNFDIIISNNRDASFCARLSFFFLNKNKTKNIYFARGFYFHDNQNFIFWNLTYLLEIILLIRTDLILSQTKEDLKKIRFFSDLFQIPVKWIGNGVKKEIFKFRLKKINKNKIIFSTICRITKGKGLEDLIDVFSTLSSAHDNLYLKIIGGPLTEDDFNYFKEIRNSNNFKLIKNKIEVTGMTDKVEYHLDMSDFYIHPSYREGMPKSLIEAMSKGLIPIASSIRGSRELIINNFNGFLYKCKDVVDLKDKILKIINLDKGQINIMSINANNSIKIYDEKLYINRQIEGIINCLK